MKSKDLPIGYWIKRADNLLTQGINKIHEEFGFARTDWQIVNAINENKGITKPELISLMQPFADSHTVEIIMIQLKEKEIILEQDCLIGLTTKGKQIWQDCSSRQLAFRKKSMQHITEADYQITVATLHQLVTNLNHG